MNAILVFDPSNDLLFVKSNHQFRSKLLKYACLNGLLAAATPDRHWTPLASSSGSSSGCEEPRAARAGQRHDKSSNRPASHQPTAAAAGCIESPSISTLFAKTNRPEVSHDVTSGGGPPKATRARYRTRKRTRQFGSAASTRTTRLDFGQRADDTSKCFTDILMLLLTPYVASLRLSNDLRGQQSDAYAEMRPPKAQASQRAHSGRENNANSATRAGHQQAQRAPGDGPANVNKLESDRKQYDHELLTKFMSSISINHECGANEPQQQHQFASTLSTPDGDSSPAGLVGGTRGQWRQQIESSDEERRASEQKQRAQRQGFSTLQMPVECLQDCQVVYCQLFDFIFIYMQELASVSSFKLRLLQRRIDLFARLALLLFGSALGSLRFNNATSTARRQTQLLRRAYDCWFAQQFQPDLFLEANERLVLGSHIGSLCGATLRKVSAELRKHQAAAAPASFAAETHQHALLFSDSKLVSRFSCLNANPLTHDDLILLLILLKAFNADHNNELPSGAPADELEEAPRRNTRDKFHYKSHYQTDRHTSQIRPPLEAGNERKRGRHWSGGERAAEMPHQLAIFLAASEPAAALAAGRRSERAQVYVPHMLRFVVLARGVTLMLISEISSAYLNGQLSRVHALLLDFNRHSLADGAGRDQVGNEAPFCNELTRPSASRQLRLSQVSRLTDCISAIKSYFFSPRLPAASPAHQIAEERAGAPAPSLLASLFGGYFAQRQRYQRAADGQPDWRNAELEPEQQFDNLELAAADAQRDWDRPSAEVEPARCQRRAWRMVERLGPTEQRLCRHLLRKLAELAQNNVQTYMRQTFGMALDEHKREALLSAVSATVRHSFSELVLEPQLARLAGQTADGHEYLRQLSDQHDRVRLLARGELNDYLDYLAVKAQCNVTLGAPLTHDMNSITGFIYIDRARQELLVSPLSKSRCSSMSWAELVEGDFEASIERQRRHEAARMSSLDEHEDGKSSELSSEDDADGRALNSSDELELDERAEEADQSESSDDSRETEELISQRQAISSHENSSEASTSDSIESIIYTGSQPLAGKRMERNDSRDLWPKLPVGHNQIGLQTRSRRGQFLGTSQDISAASSSADSSQQSMQMLGIHQSAGGFFGGAAQRTVSGSDRHLDRVHLMARLEATCRKEQQTERRLGAANEQLLQGFSAFIYNRLAGGQTSSFSQNCGHSQLSYFMWLKRQTVSSEAFLDGVRADEHDDDAEL